MNEAQQWNQWVAIAVSVATALGLRELIGYLFNRKHSAAQTAATEVQTIRDVLYEVRANDAGKSVELSELRRRIDALEERERHRLTREAVHDAWDQMTYAAILLVNPAHPSPPPLTAPEGTPT